MSYSIFKNFLQIFYILGVISVLGCGYTLQTSQSDLYWKEGVHKIYILPIVNNSYKPGVEIFIFNSMIRTLVSHQRVVLVHSKQDADALLSGFVDSAAYASVASLSVSSLNPSGVVTSSFPTSNFGVASVYNAVLSCTFSLDRVQPRPGHPSHLWSAVFSRSKQFPGSNQLDVLGTTSPLINESEFDRALQDLSRSMMDDVHESMLAMF